MSCLSGVLLRDQKTSGIYDVLHDKIDGEDHAQQHQVIVIVGAVFPRCKGCGE